MRTILASREKQEIAARKESVVATGTLDSSVDSQKVISVAASVVTNGIEDTLSTNVPVVRAVPITPCMRLRHDSAAQGKWSSMERIWTQQSAFSAGSPADIYIIFRCHGSEQQVVMDLSYGTTTFK